MHIYRVYFDDGTDLLVHANTEEAACILAERLEPGTHALRAERVA